MSADQSAPRASSSSLSVPNRGSSSASVPKRGSASLSVPNRGSSSASVPKRGSASLSVPNRGSSSASVPKRGSASLSVPNRGSSSASVPNRPGSDSPSSGGTAGAGRSGSSLVIVFVPLGRRHPASGSSSLDYGPSMEDEERSALECDRAAFRAVERDRLVCGSVG